MRRNKFNWLIISFAAIFAAALLSSCQHRPLVDIGNTHYVRVYIDDSILNVTKGIYNPEYDNPVLTLPPVVRAVLYDKNTGMMISDKYLQETGRDEKGYYLDGYITAPPGDYKFMAYNFGTETTQLVNEDDYEHSEAYTNEISKMFYARFPRSADFLNNNEKVVQEPDHLWVAAQESIHITPKGEDFIDTLFNSSGDYFKAQTIVKTYYLQVKVIGIQWVKSSIAILSGMAGSEWLYNHTIDENDPASLYFEMKSGPHTEVTVTEDENAAKSDNDKSDNDKTGTTTTEVATIYTSFNTFGKLPGEESELVITFAFIKTDGTSQVETLLITPSFYTENGIKRQWLLLDDDMGYEIIITPPYTAGGGFAPGVDDWNNENAEIKI